MMTSSLLIPSLALALTTFTGAVGLFLLGRSRSRKAVKDRLQDMIVDTSEDGEIRAAILRDVSANEDSTLRKTLQGLPPMRRIETLLTQADVSMRLEGFLALMLALVLVTGAVTYAVWHQWLVAVAAGAAVTVAPVMWLVRRKRVRVAQFERHFPDALDMLTSALRAGLAFSGAIHVVSEEAPHAVAKEFTVLFEEHRLGLDLREALLKLSRRIDSTELRLFVTAVILQKETGGNLTEILDRTAAVIRDRFRILGDVKTMTAQAKLSGLILSALPIALAGVIFILAPDYLKVLRDDPAGPYLVVVAVTLQIVGYTIMNRIISIKV
jgi:tight adherence protein B